MAFNMNPTSNQVKYPFNGALNPNEVFGAIYNMIINQYVKDPSLVDNYGFVDQFRDQGSMFGDTILIYDQDVLSTRNWLGDAEAQNLLALERPDDPECQAITLNQFRICKTSLDSYLTKRAWSTAGAFNTFNNIVINMVAKTKKLYEVTLLNAFLGTVNGDTEKSTVEVPLSTITATGEEKNRLEAQTIAQYLADLFVELKDYSRDYNSYGFMRAYDEDRLMVIWNSKFVNKINKIDLPTIFNKAGLMEKFEQNQLPSRYFGEVIDGSSTPTGITLGSDGYFTITESYTGNTVRTADEGVFTSGHKFAGEALSIGDKFLPGKAYVEDEDVICKVITRDAVKYLSCFETATEFHNPQALTTSHMLIWGFSNPTRVLGEPCVTLHAD